MKALFLFLVSLLYFQEIAAQRAVVANDYANIAYLIVPNPLHFAVEGSNCSEFTITTNNGSIKMFEDSCTFYFYPEKVGSAIITIKRKKKKFLKNVQYFVRAYPLPKANIGGSERGIIKKSRLLANEGVIARINDFGYDARALIQSYTINILRNDTTLLAKRYSGPQFPNELRIFFNNLQADDKLIFSEINCKISNNTYKIEPLFLTVIE